MQKDKLHSVIEKINNGNFDYTEGVSVFSQFTNNRILVRNLLLKQNKSNTEKLIYELIKLAKHEKSEKQNALQPRESLLGTVTPNFSAPAQKELDPPMDHRSSSDPGIDYSNHTPSVHISSIQSELQTKRKDLYRARGHFHGGMHNCTTDTERYSFAKKVLDTQTQIDSVNKELNQLQNGVIPSNYLKQSATGEQVIELRNVKIYIGRYEKKLATAKTPAEKLKFESKLEEYKNKLKSLL